VVMGFAYVRRAADFCTDALCYVPRDGKVDDDWTVLVPADGLGTPLG